MLLRHGLSGIAYKSAGGGGGAPTDAGRVAWWDASDTGTISDSGGTVTSVANKVGGGNALVPDATGQQTTGATTRGGNNVIDFTGTSNPLEADITFTGTDFAVWMVVEIGAIDNSGDSILGLKGATNILTLRANDGSVFNGFTNCNWGNGGAWTGGPYSGWCIIKQEADRSGTNTFSTDVNGSNVFSGPLTSDPETTQRIYVHSSQFVHMPGSLAEIIFTTDITVDYLSYLQGKWGF